jgi:hypothetical protein
VNIGLPIDCSIGIPIELHHCITKHVAPQKPPSAASGHKSEGLTAERALREVNETNLEGIMNWTYQRYLDEEEAKREKMDEEFPIWDASEGSEE